MNMDNRERAEDIFRAALRASDPYLAVKSHTGRILSLYREGGFRRFLLVGMGKASSEMARALEDEMGDLVDEGIIITKHGGGRGPEEGEKARSGRVKILEAGHPVPDENGLRAAEKVARLLEGADEKTLVVCLISGGGSALLSLPHEGVTLAEKQELTQVLLKSGASINELNALRKHISAVKGGRLARMAYPARVVSLIISDVIGDSIEVIASGPTSPDSTTYAHALEILRKYSVTRPEGVLRLIEKGAAGELPETPKLGDRLFERVENIIVSNNRGALEGAKKRAEEIGLPAEITAEALSGDVSEAARFLLEEIQRRGERPICLLSGGETTVVVRGKGKGGRNMHLALMVGMAIEGKPGITLLSAGTDGTDGPTDAAGAVVEGATMANARAAGISPEEYFSDHNSYNFFRRTGDILITGPTGTNVMDIQVLLLT